MPVRSRSRSSYLLAAGVLSAVVSVVIGIFAIVLVKNGGIAFAISLASLLAAVLIFAYFGRSDSQNSRVAVTAGAAILVAFGLALPVVFYLISGPASDKSPSAANKANLVGTPHSQSPTPSSITVEITEPARSTTCTNPPNEGTCLFTTTGRSKGVTNKNDLFICVLVYPVKPSGDGWYFQIGEATVRPDGTWSKIAGIGAPQYPAHKGDTFRIVALVVSRDAMIGGTRLNKLTPGVAIDEPGRIAPHFAESKIVDLTVVR
jgi:hypothetical protein